METEQKPSVKSHDEFMSTEINKIGEALCKAQGAMRPATKDSENPYFKSKYADLATVWETIRGPLSENGLSIVQQPGGNNDIVSVTTLLIHNSGQWIKSTISASPSKKDPQGVGSCLTYLRRYAISAMVGVSTEDDDANEASLKNHTTNRPAQKDQKPFPIPKEALKDEKGAVLIEAEPSPDKPNEMDFIKKLNDEQKRVALDLIDLSVELIGMNEKDVSDLLEMCSEYRNESNIVERAGVRKFSALNYSRAGRAKMSQAEYTISRMRKLTKENVKDEILRWRN